MLKKRPLVEPSIYEESIFNSYTKTAAKAVTTFRHYLAPLYQGGQFLENPGKKLVMESPVKTQILTKVLEKA